jgi:uncharacterized membrane protein YdjX (TVP38/TMEM64 family)
VVLAAVIVPFVLWGDALEAWTRATLLAHRPAGWAPRAACVLLLAGDIVLPVPSSIVSAAAGMWWGVAEGAALSLLGMQLGSWAGYAIGARAAAVRRWIGEDAAARLDRAYARHGEWMVMTLRPVPVLAEASAVFAGFAHMHAGRYTAMSLAANAVVSLAYAGAGALVGRDASGAAMLVVFGVLVLGSAAFSLARRRAG